MTAVLTIDMASVRFGNVQALSDISLSLARGQRLALVGANGSGKTSLLRLMHGLLPSTGRRVLHVLQPEARAPRLAMVYQRPFLMNLSVQKNVALALWLRGWPAAERAQRCTQALQRVGLLAHAQRPARDLSGGQQQRLALARAWSVASDVLLLDEPTASLDPGAKREVEALLEDFAQEGMTLVMSTHNLGQAKRLATHVAYLEAGRLVVIAPVAEFFNAELPAAAMSFLRGELLWA